MSRSAGTVHDAPAIVARRGALRLQRGHPWGVRSDIDTRPNVPAGIVPVLGVNGTRLGWALWSPESEISLRLIERDIARKPDDAWWHEQIATAIRRRDSLRAANSAYRLVHGEG